MLRLPEFEFLEPTSLDEAVRMHQDAGDSAMFVAGGTDLYPNMKRRHQEPKTVVSLAGVEELSLEPVIRQQGGTEVMAIGANVSLTAIAANPLVLNHFPALSKAAESVSTPALRNMGTIGGNLCLDTRCTYYNQSFEWRKSIDFCMKKDGDICWVAPNSPRCWAVNSSDTAPVMIALGASFVLVGPKGERVVPAPEFYKDDGIEYLNKSNAEVLKEIQIPTSNNSFATYMKLRRRGSFDFPVLGVAVWTSWSADRVDDARIVLGAVASYPRIIPEAADAIIGTMMDDDSIDLAAAAAFKPSKPMDNTDLGLAWRKQMTRVYVERALKDVLSQKKR
jgi:4-hydroxybenzoyl-CoA reductase subunit beta